MIEPMPFACRAVLSVGVTLLPQIAVPTTAAKAQDASRPSSSSSAQQPPLPDPQTQLRGTQASIDASAERRRSIQAEIDKIRTDHAKLTEALLDTTRRVSADEQKITATQRRLDDLGTREKAIRHSLDGRRAVIAEVLAALQRMGRKPPPALLVDPEDVLKAIRTSMLLGSVLPGMEAEIEVLVTDLTELSRVRHSIGDERRMLDTDLAGIKAERERLTALIDARQAALGQAEGALGAERDRAQALAQQASSLKDLIARMESDSKPAAEAAEAARKSDEQRQAAATLNPGATLAPSAPRNPGRLAPAVSFATLKGSVPPPVAGSVVRGFGATDDFGGTERGVTFETAASAVVAAPSDGWVAYVGPYRSFGQLLIVNAGNGYYIVLAGMERTNVDLGQFVLAGEPVGVMGDGSHKTAAAVALGESRPVLYVEFRKDGATIDPGPWWAKPELQRVRG